MGAEGRGYPSGMGVVLWWSILLLLSLGGFAWASRWAFRADLATARDRRTLEFMARQLDGTMDDPAADPRTRVVPIPGDGDIAGREPEPGGSAAA